MSEIEVVIPTSPIPIHPSTEIIKRVVASVRYHLPDSIIHILADGVRPEVEHRRKQYEEYLAELEDWCSNPGSDIYLTSFEEHKQQSGLMNYIIETIQTPLIAFFEHDVTLDAKPIDWEEIKSILLSGQANMVRLYWNQGIHKDHDYLMQGMLRPHFVKTVQYSQWPNIATTKFYRQILQKHFAPEQKSMLETVMYSPVVESPWEEYKIVIYLPDGDTIRFHHWNARVDPVTGERDKGDW